MGCTGDGGSIGMRRKTVSRSKAFKELIDRGEKLHKHIGPSERIGLPDSEDMHHITLVRCLTSRNHVVASAELCGDPRTSRYQKLLMAPPIMRSE